ncbi:unnamed protein product [Rotaria sp. Silwood2]|nr:unnamed protein product [Rotaria sp. Silwood2]CAF4229963.1 unnamed protein product [Rotaria sp. Silwood2]
MLVLLLSTIFTLLLSTSAKECLSRSSTEQSLLDAHVPGAAIMVVNHTDILYQEAFGHRSLSPVRMMDVDTSIFVLASISKPFVAVAVMQLVEANKLDLDADINPYLLSSSLSSLNHRIFHPQYPSHPITLRQLLSHSASIGTNKEAYDTFMQIGDTALTKISLADACYTYLDNSSNWLPLPPGTVSFYSDVGNGLAGLVVERVSQMPFEHYVRENILKPLNIDTKKAGYRLSDIDNHDELVKHHVFKASFLEQWDRELPQLNIKQVNYTTISLKNLLDSFQSNLSNWVDIPFYSVSIYPAGLLRMSAKSLSLFLRMLMRNGYPLLHSHSIAEMRRIVDGVIPYQSTNSTNSTELPDRVLSFGLGLIWEEQRDGRRFIGHTGGMPAATHSMVINEQGNIGVIFLTNGDVSANNEDSIKMMHAWNTIRISLFNCFEI